jgi:hypothetical protein
MSRATLDLGIACENDDCKHAVRIIVVTTVAKGAPPVSPASSPQAAATSLGMVRVHEPNANARILCAACRGRTICRSCGIERIGNDLCSSPSFDVDRDTSIPGGGEW